MPSYRFSQHRQSHFVLKGLGVIGIFIVAIQRANPPKAPQGMRAVWCPRCNAVQNIPNDRATFECWQCKLSSNATGASDSSEDAREWLNSNKKEPDE